MSARVTFGNINGHTQPVPHVSLKTEEVLESAYTDTISNTGTTVNPIIAVRGERETKTEGERERVLIQYTFRVLQVLKDVTQAPNQNPVTRPPS